MEHSPLPWRVTQEDGDNYIRDTQNTALMCDAPYYPWVTPEDFPYIIEACNAYPRLVRDRDELLAAVKRLLPHATDYMTSGQVADFEGSYIDLIRSIENGREGGAS